MATSTKQRISKADQERPEESGNVETSANSTSGRAPADQQIAIESTKDGAGVAQRDVESGPRSQDARGILQFDLVLGDITDVDAPLAVCAHQEGMPLVGNAGSFDRILDTWLTQAIDLQIIGGRLGQLFPLRLGRFQLPKQVRIGELLLVGLGEPGQLAPGDVRFAMSNVAIAVKSMGFTTFATNLIGTRRRELSVSEAARGLVEGLIDGFSRLGAMSETSTYNQNWLQAAAAESLRVIIVASDEVKLIKMRDVFLQIDVPEKFRVQVGEIIYTEGKVPAGAHVDELADDPFATLLRVTRKQTPEPEGGIFEFSAVSESAMVAVRESVISNYIHENLPRRLIEATDHSTRERFGRFFAASVIPDDFKRLVERAVNLTLEVDETSALHPWEMMAHSRNGQTVFVGTSMCASRQFRTQFAPPPTAPAPPSRVLRVLLIADPASGSRALPGAREEGWAVVKTFETARRLWEDVYDIKLTVRIGSSDDDDPALKERLDSIRKNTELIVSAEKCDPLEVNMQIATEQFDVVHYAGHGFFDEKRLQAGWILDQKCWLSADDLFRVRQVPRLVFANACFSSVTPSAQKPDAEGDRRRRFVGAAMAFFRRGIPNFIGAGWQVNDASASVCSQYFYALALGLERPDAKALPSRPELQTIAAALRDARHATMRVDRKSSTWGAYQHYGRASDRLLAPSRDDLLLFRKVRRLDGFIRRI